MIFGTMFEGIGGHYGRAAIAKPIVHGMREQMNGGRLSIARHHDATAAVLFEIVNDRIDPLPMRTVVAALDRQSEPRCHGAGEWFDMTRSDSQAMICFRSCTRDVRLCYVKPIHADVSKTVNTAASHEFRSQA